MMNFPWNKSLWLYARASEYQPTRSLYSRHQSGYYIDLVRTSQKSTTESENPLLIVSSTGAPSKATERWNILAKFEKVIMANFLFSIFRVISSGTVQAGGNAVDSEIDEKGQKIDDSSDVSLHSDEEVCRVVTVEPIKEIKKRPNKSKSESENQPMTKKTKFNFKPRQY